MALNSGHSKDFIFLAQAEAFPTHPQFHAVSVDLSHSGASIKTTLLQVLSGLGRNASTLMQSLYQFITQCSSPPRLPSSASLLVNIKSCIIYYLRAGKLMNILKKKRGIPSAVWSQLLKFVKRHD